jgi:hypothetical protein
MRCQVTTSGSDQLPRESDDIMHHDDEQVEHSNKQKVKITSTRSLQSLLGIKQSHYKATRL